MNKKKVALLCGGRSGEHEVSLVSANAIAGALDRERYDVLIIAIDRQGKWWLGEHAIARMQKGEEPYGDPVHLLPEPGRQGLIRLTAQGWEEIPVQIFFPVLHGPNGEDGTIQGLLELANVPYVGCGVLASACGMDKGIMKMLFSQAGLSQVPYQVVQRLQWEKESSSVIETLEESIGYPLFVKPANMGSSVGISKASNRQALQEAFAEALLYDNKVVVEKGVEAREIEVSVLGNNEVSASIPGEIVPCNDFYDYTAKYIDDRSRLLIPAPLTQEESEALQQMAIQAFKAIDGTGLARVDFFMDKKNGQIWINEINTLPGFTSISMYPKLWQSSGLGYSDLLHRLIELAEERHQEKQTLLVKPSK
ncbi:D-alanine--D-alanine ligase [Heliorestis convoluta]|uniref:D-alanine--D-alanine ligase n=1 Tax=Heliorestis convoluta TaxID=356322 RepID=A0A5Q2MXZ2_9FIRM|nr:D-alanine--D-alanine ligase [Heliorestis convoluta]QGG46761.1 D-alanine--D-alanine ligase family protein [Heliorestis convoluta]